jgi:toxin ParE1/3/4
MNSRVILRPQVPSDLLSLMDHLALKGSPELADRFVKAARATMERLAKWPGIGSPKQFKSRRLAGTRSWPVDGFPNHLIFYRPVDDGILVLAVLHGARNLPRALRDR